MARNSPADDSAAVASRRRRGQKQRHADIARTGSPPSPNPSNSQAQAIRMHLQNLERAKRKVQAFKKAALCLALVWVGCNIYRRRGGIGSGASFVGEAFQHMNDAYRRDRSDDRGRPLFGSAAASHPRHVVPKDMLQDFGSYPNIFNITEDMRRQFHPVVKIPLREGSCVEQGSKRRGLWPWRRRNKNRPAENDSPCSELDSRRRMNETYDYIIKDYRPTANNDRRVILEGGERLPQLLPTREEAVEHAKRPGRSRTYDVGKYDEDRRGMYTSSLFGDAGEESRRTVHIGVDIGAPVGTALHAFEDGVVHSAGYNPDVGDYGHVIVIEHHLENEGKITRVYALYGHLSSKSIRGKHPGQKIKRGQTIGYLGNTAENGGWTGAHVHFQLAVNPPPHHDMPGVVAVKDREDALLEYVDPRYVLGELY